MMLDAVLRHPLGGPVVVASLMLVLVWICWAVGWLFTWACWRYDRWSIRREMRQEARRHVEALCQRELRLRMIAEGWRR